MSSNRIIISRRGKTVADFPDVAAQWHPTKNGDVTPEMVMAGSEKKYWWRCKGGHEWEARVGNRTRGNGCPYCIGYKVSNTNSLASHYPYIAAQWHPTKNGDVAPEMVTAFSDKKCWWQCKEGHEWEAVVASRTRGRGCSYCSGHKVSNTNSLASRYPDISAQWHPTKNCDVTPEMMVAGSHKKYWWQCKEGHEWEARVGDRTRGNGCSCCNRGWMVSAIRAFVASLIPHLSTLSPADYYICAEQNGLLYTQGKSKGFVKALLTGKAKNEDLINFANGESSYVDDILANESLLTEQEDTIANDIIDSVIVPIYDKDCDGIIPLPIVEARDALAFLDHPVIRSADSEAVMYFKASALDKIWNHVYENESEAVVQAEKCVGDIYLNETRDVFLAEYGAARALRIPKGYAFKVEGVPTQPNLMQRLVATRIRERRRYGNWSTAGAGKTLSAILATRVVGAQLSIICCPNSVVGYWHQAIQNAFPKSAVQTKTWDPKWEGSHPRYLIQNYEQFQQPDSEEKLKTFLDREQLDFIIIDEIHFAKQRHSENFSQRKRLVMALVTVATEKKPDVCVLGMSATPVINNLQEGRSLIELVTGEEHNDIDTKATVSNCISLYKKLMVLGTRYSPNYKMQFNKQIIDVDCSHMLDKIQALQFNNGPLALERILTEVRLPSILQQLQPGRKTLIYSYYIDGIDEMLVTAVKAAGYKVGLFTSNEKSGLDGFLHRDVDVLIGSSAISFGVDGLQHVCKRIIINVLPWTHSEYQQIVGRIYRQGQRAEQVDIIIPVTYAEVNGQRWSYCDSKLARINYKKSIADAAVDGIIPEGSLRSAAQAHADLMSWLKRLDRGEENQITRRKITVPLNTSNKASVRRRLGKYGDFSRMNARWNATGSGKLHEALLKDPTEWEQYHTLYRQACESWSIVPYKEVIEWASHHKNFTIGDFGCGEALLAEALSDRHVVHSFDHVAINDHVIATDIAHTQLDSECLDVAVFSLSLMGANFTDYLREAHRTLKFDGRLLIWEGLNRFSDSTIFCRDLEKIGFRCYLPREQGSFLCIEARKTERAPDPDIRLAF